MMKNSLLIQISPHWRQYLLVPNLMTSIYLSRASENIHRAVVLLSQDQ